jgi:hypothetical protein
VREIKDYEDIITMQAPVSKKHPPMSLENRAAQFAPFAALTGFDLMIEETAVSVRESYNLQEPSQENQFPEL